MLPKQVGILAGVSALVNASTNRCILPAGANAMSNRLAIRP
jgi:hypothetical protein